MKRRTFLAVTGAAAAATGPVFAQGAEGKKRRVAVIGHSGRGNYGHGLDTVWLKLPEVEVVGVADADAGGLAKAVGRLKTDRGFSDYRRMLEEMKPEFVTVCPRHADQHGEMTLAAIEAGVKGVYVEKPFVRTPKEADEIVAACEEHGAKVAVAHRNRYHPALPVIAQLVADRRIGKLLEIRGRGKGDQRGGGEDLWVLGSHVMNLMHFLGGDPRTCSAVLRQEGVAVGLEHVQEGAEGLGPLAGDEVHARYEMAKGLIATFDSIALDGTGGAGFGVQLIGSEGIINMRCDIEPFAHLIPGNPFLPSEEARPWVPITGGGVGVAEPDPAAIERVHTHVAPVRDLIAACDEDRAPLCDVAAGATTVEMICAVFASHAEGGKAVAIPLEGRGNALVLLERAGVGPALQAEVVPAGKDKFPVAAAIPGRPGFCFNPFTNNPVDLRGIPPGALVRDPQDPDPTHKFRAP